jgi:hypothetical protein
MDTFGLVGLIRNRNVARLAANLLGANGAMTVDTDGDGVVDGFSKVSLSCSGTFALDGGQKITLGTVTAANAQAYVYLTTKVAVSPNTAYVCSVDALLNRSTNETVEIGIVWYTAADAEISTVLLTGQNPGTSFNRIAKSATSPATAAKVRVYFVIRASAIGDTGSACFKDVLFQPA